MGYIRLSDGTAVDGWQLNYSGYEGAERLIAMAEALQPYAIEGDGNFPSSGQQLILRGGQLTVTPFGSSIPGVAGPET
jgi:hypothetical protein